MVRVWAGLHEAGTAAAPPAPLPPPPVVDGRTVKVESGAAMSEAVAAASRTAYASWGFAAVKALLWVVVLVVLLLLAA